MMYVPKGFAHGFVTLEQNTEILYLVSSFYVPDSEGILIWNDPKVKIDWPIKYEVISNKDINGSKLDSIVSIKLIS